MDDVLQDMTIRPMQEKDLPVLARWLQQPEVFRYYGGEPAAREEVDSKYLPRIRGEEEIPVYIIDFRSSPVGFMQVYTASSDVYNAGGYPPDTILFGMDLLIGASRMNQGLGTAAVSLMSDHLLASGADAVVLDPETDNSRARRSYEKAGFRLVGRMDAGRLLLMAKSTPSSAQDER
ncbi:GNAT family N-acetyltransferase [Alkalicoccus chagannorensis]|uniref:GNAT family N-acetyltransferase n=1 Tax=Alkalicoccus chagannorensis TaxID=427072 RepID=UPI0003F69D25|nr:GNAT family N-acetyltransferase [Alkalicoccus chagannorensis]